MPYLQAIKRGIDPTNGKRVEQTLSETLGLEPPQKDPYLTCQSYAASDEHIRPEHLKLVAEAAKTIEAFNRAGDEKLAVWKIEKFALARVEVGEDGPTFDAKFSYLVLHMLQAPQPGSTGQSFLWHGKNSGLDRRGAAAIYQVFLTARIDPRTDVIRDGKGLDEVPERCRTVPHARIEHDTPPDSPEFQAFKAAIGGTLRVVGNDKAEIGTDFRKVKKRQRAATPSQPRYDGKTVKAIIGQMEKRLGGDGAA